MSNHRRVIDASKWNVNMNSPNVNTKTNFSMQKQPQMHTQAPQPRITYIPKQVVRQQTPQYTVSVNPNTNVIYQDVPPHPIQHVQQPIQSPAPQQIPQQVQPQVQPQHVQQVNTPVENDQAQHKTVRKDQKVSTFGYDPDMKNFDLTGCKTIEDVYNKNAKKIKIIPE
jgi:hypothetical protein